MHLIDGLVMTVAYFSINSKVAFEIIEFGSQQGPSI